MLLSFRYHEFTIIVIIIIFIVSIIRIKNYIPKYNSISLSISISIGLQY